MTLFVKLKSVTFGNKSELRPLLFTFHHFRFLVNSDMVFSIYIFPVSKIPLDGVKSLF